MDFNDIRVVTQLTQEKMAIQRALQILNNGGRITAMTVGALSSSGPTVMPPGLGGVTVPTGYIEYPAGMVDAIRSAFEARQQTIAEELAKLGVTGVPEQMQPGPAYPQRRGR